MSNKYRQMIISFCYSRILIYCFLLFIVSACAVGPDYKRPEIQLPAHYQQAGELPLAEDNQEKEVKSNAWWLAFNDEILNNLVTEGVKNNKTVLQALSRVNQSRALARESLAGLFPGAQISGDYKKTKLSGVQFGGSAIDYELYKAGVDAAWEIDLFGKLRRSLEAKNAEYAARTADLQDAIAILVADLTRTYLQLRTNQQQLVIAEKNLELQEETLEIISARLNAGTTSELDLSRSKSQYARTKAELPPLRSLVKANIHRLSVLTGHNPGELIEKLAAMTDIPDYSGELSLDQVSEILEKRPDIRSAENELNAYTAMIGVETAELFPSLQLTGSIGYENSKWSNLLDGKQRVFSYGPVLNWTPFDFGSIRSRIRASEARAEEALNAYQQTVLLALEEVENSLAEYHAQLESANLLSSAVIASDKAYQLAKTQYQVGALDLLALLDTQSNLLSDQLALLNNQFSLNSAIIDIYKALGSGWQEWDLMTLNGK